MRTIARFMDARNTAEGKFLSVLLSVLLVFSFLNVTMFTDYAGADTTPEGDGTEIVTPLEDVDEPEAQPEDEADGPESDEPAEEVNETEPAAEPETPAVAEESEAAEEQPVAAPEETYPAQKLTAKANDGATIVVTAPEGALPANSSMKASTVSTRSVENAVEEVVADEGKKVQDLAAYSITLFNESGDEVVPAKKVRVSIQGADVSGETVEVMTVDGNGAAAKVAGTDANGDASFQAAGEEAAGNVYVLVGTLKEIKVPEITQKPVTVKVVYSNGVIRDVSAMALSWNEGEGAFKGTYNLHLDGFTVKSVDGINESAVADDTLNLSFSGKDNTDPVIVTVVIEGEVAKYTVNHYLTALDGTPELKEKETLEGTVGVMTTAAPKQYEGFTADAVQQAQVKADGSTVVDITYTRNTYKLTYDTTGGSYIAPKTGQFEEEVEAYSHIEGTRELTCGKEEHSHTARTGDCYTLTCDKWWHTHKNSCYTLTCGKETHTHEAACYTVRPENWDPEPIRQGYTFTGWYADKECTVKADPSITLTDNVTIYAGWEAQQTIYTVAYFEETVDSATGKRLYSYVDSDPRTAKVGDEVTGTNDISRPYRHFARATTEIVKADGSTVVNVYYDLTTYKLVFNLNDSRNAKGSIEMNGKTYYGSEYSIDVVLGQDISELWPTTAEVSRTNGNSLDTWAYDSDYVSAMKTKIVEVNSEVLSQANNENVVNYTATWMTGGDPEERKLLAPVRRWEELREVGEVQPGVR